MSYETVRVCKECPKVIMARRRIKKGPFPFSCPDNCESCGVAYISHPDNDISVCRTNCGDFYEEGINDEFNMYTCGDMVA